MALCELYMGVHAWGVEDPYLGYAQRWLFGGLCGLLPRRRLQPDSAARAEPVFPTRRETATEGALPAHHGGWGARATRRNSRRSLRRNSVHKCPKTAPRGHFRRSVYTPAFPRPPARPGGPRVPRHRQPHGPRDTRMLGPEATPPGGDTTSYPYELTKSLFLVCCRRRRAIWTRRSRAPRSSRR